MCVLPSSRVEDHFWPSLLLSWKTVYNSRKDSSDVGYSGIRLNRWGGILNHFRDTQDTTSQ